MPTVLLLTLAFDSAGAGLGLDGRSGGALAFLTANAEARAARHRDRARAAIAAGDLLGFAAHLRVHALYRLAVVQDRLPPGVARGWELELDAAGAAGGLDGAAGDARRPAGEPLSRLLEIVPKLRPAASRSPALRAALSVLLRPPRGVRELRLSESPPAGGVAAEHSASGTTVEVRFAGRLSSGGHSEQRVAALVMFELLNTRSIPASRVLQHLARRRALTRLRYVNASVDLEQLEKYQAQLTLCSILDAGGAPWPVDPASWWVDLPDPPPQRPPPFAPVRSRGYPWAWFGRSYEWRMIDAHRDGQPLWPAWVAIRRLQAYPPFDDEDGLMTAWVRRLEWEARGRLPYELLDALPPADWRGGST